MTPATRAILERHMLTTEQFPGCAYGGLGCTGEHMRSDVIPWQDDEDEWGGWDNWVDPACVEVMIPVTTCTCGASDAYGEMSHEDRCPLA